MRATRLLFDLPNSQPTALGTVLIDYARNFVGKIREPHECIADRPDAQADSNRERS